MAEHLSAAAAFSSSSSSSGMQRELWWGIRGLLHQNPKKKAVHPGWYLECVGCNSHALFWMCEHHHWPQFSIPETERTFWWNMNIKEGNAFPKNEGPLRSSKGLEIQNCSLFKKRAEVGLWTPTLSVTVLQTQVPMCSWEPACFCPNEQAETQPRVCCQRQSQNTPTQ